MTFNNRLSDYEESQIIARHRVGTVLRHSRYPKATFVVASVVPGKVLRTSFGDALIHGVYECVELPQVPLSVPARFEFRDIHRDFVRDVDAAPTLIIEGLA